MLQNRKKHDKETYWEYLHSLMVMRKQIGLDEESLIQHLTDGIPAFKQNKTILCQNKDLDDIKDKLKVYENICSMADKARKQV